MKITLSSGKKEPGEIDLLVNGVFQAKSKKKSDTCEIDASEPMRGLNQKLSSLLLASARQGGFSAKESDSFVTASLGLSKASSIGLIGLGTPDEQSVDTFRRAGGNAFKIAKNKRAKKVLFLIPEKTSVPMFDVVQALAEGFYLASYRFDKYISRDKDEHPVKEVVIDIPHSDSPELKTALTRARIVSNGVCLARDLVNEGPMELNPQRFAEHATEVAPESGLQVDILDEKRLKKEKMRLMLAVASAAQPFVPPRLIRLHYKPKKASKQRVVLIGKGVTFDSGGLDIKTADGMLDMKIDMSGAATVMGTMCAIGQLDPKVEVFGYLGCVENGVGPHSYHPGDIIISRKGLSVEINNTDAEGRLVMADMIHYATERDNPTIIIDVATLTGACMIALGLSTAGIFANDDALCDCLCQSGKTVGESFWRMPLNPTLKEGLKSPVADLKNCGDRYGGSITAALFLEEFIEKEIKWAHLDIAGPASNSKSHPYLSSGGVGFGVRTLVDYLMSLK